MKSLSDKAGFLIIANLVKYAVGFVMPMVLVRMLSQGDYGIYQQMILIGTAAVGMLTLGLPTSIYYFYHYVGEKKIPALIAQTTILLAISGVLATLAVFFGSGYFSSTFNNPGMTGLLKLYAISLMFMIGSEHCLHFMIAQNRYSLGVLFEIAETFIRVLTLLAPLWFGYGFTGLIVGIVIYSALRFVVRNAYLFGCSGLHFRGWSHQTFVKDQLAYSIPLALVSVSSLIANTVNRGLVAASFTPVHYAIYAVGALEIPVDVIFQASVANVLRASLPALVRTGDLTEIVRITREAIRKLSIIVLPSFVFLFGNAHDFITLLFTSSYAQSVDVFRIYLWLMPLHMFVLSSILHSFAKTKLNLYIILTTTVALLVLSYVLLKIVGFYGPAIAMVITQYIQTFMYLAVVLKLTKSSVGQLLPLKHMAGVVAVSVLSLLLSRMTDHLTASKLLNLVIGGTLFSLIFLSTAALVGIFSKQDILLMKRWIGKFLPFGLV